MEHVRIHAATLMVPVYQTNTNGNGRADLMRMAQVVFACAPNVLAVPVAAEGKRAFKLGLMAAANNIDLDNAHDALADAAAALGIAKLSGNARRRYGTR